MAEKETIHVPARQLQLARPNRTGLINDLFPNETGWSEEDKTLFYKTAGGDVLPIGDSPVVVISGGTKRSKIMALVAAGKIPVVKMVQGQGDKYMYPAWTGSDKLRFSSTMFTNDSSVTGFWWADVPRSDDANWTYGYTSLTGTADIEDEYNENGAYTKGSLRYHLGVLYRAKNDIGSENTPAGPWDSTKWEVAKIGRIMASKDDLDAALGNIETLLAAI